MSGEKIKEDFARISPYLDEKTARLLQGYLILSMK